MAAGERQRDGRGLPPTASATAMDQFFEGGLYQPHQHPQYIIMPDDDHDHGWGHPGGPAPLAVPAAPDPLPPLPGIGSRYPGKPVAPMVPVGLGDDDEATESEDERPARGRGAPVLAWQPQHGSGLRPESALTGASQQPSPTPSVSLHAAAPPAAGVPAPAPAAAAPKGGSKGAAKARKPGGKGGISLRLLIEEGILQPGHNVLSVVSGRPRCMLYLDSPWFTLVRAAKCWAAAWPCS